MADGIYFTPAEQAIVDLLEQTQIELRGIRLALIHMATQDGKAVPDDFDITSPINISEVTQQLE
jgi:hypothetical protein